MRHFLVILMVFSQPIFSLEEDWRVRLLNERYDDFFNRIKREQVYNERREAGAFEIKLERDTYQRKMDLARQNYILHRPPPPDVGPALREWHKEQAEEERKHKIAHREYVEVKQKVLRLMSTAKKIPENVEYDLD